MNLDDFFSPPERSLERIAAARRVRNQEPEVNGDGSATFAEITRMSCGPEPGTWRLRVTPYDDPWYYHA